MKRTLLPLLLLTAGASLLLLLWKQNTLDASAGQTRWYKGNTHTHTLWSDGNDFPDMVIAWYRDRDYDFLALSDHNVLSRGERWMREEDIQKRRRSLGVSTLEKYRARFGSPLVETRVKDGAVEVRLRTLEELRPYFEKPGEFLLIEAEEITDSWQNLPVHLNALNLPELIEPQRGDSVRDVMRNNLRAAAEMEKRSGQSILVHLNHPNFGWGVSAEDLGHVLEEPFFEVYNGHPSVHHLGDAEHASVERMWDIANTIRLHELKAPPLYGLATDDSHHYHGGDVSPGRGWIMVRAPALETEALIAAMRAGDFYASSGVLLDSIHFDGKKLEIVIASQGPETYETNFIGARSGDPQAPGVVLATVPGARPQYRLQGDELYVRATVTSSKAHPNPSFQGQHEQAWTQPTGWRNRF
ncbi:MAG TPA: hypothetical protein VMN36_08810 [Verrucomicrobiales bacterium]|nr:hypothetical protein [Verrucomicrobiales bacterium]